MRDEKRVMVLDDEIVVGEGLKPMLDREGLTVDVLTDGSQAIETLKQKSYAVLVADIKMRGPSGMEILRFVKTYTASTRVIKITSHATDEMNHEAQALSVHHFIPRPFKGKEVVRLVQQASKGKTASVKSRVCQTHNP